MVCCLLCFRRGKCVAHLLLPPLEHSTASSVALPHVSHSHIFYVASVHSICHFWSFTFSNQSSFFFVAFFVFVCLCFFFLPHLHSLPSCLSVSAPWPPHCRLSSTFSPASRHVVSSISRVYSSLKTLFFPSQTGNVFKTCFYMCLSLWMNVVYVCYIVDINLFSYCVATLT